MERYSHTYDAAGRLTGVSIPGEGTITFNADSRGLPSGVTLPGGTSKQFGYDPLMSLVTNVAVDSAQNAVMSRIYSRNKVQNIIGQETEHGTYAYQYDQLDQLTNSIHPVFTNESFSYDPMGNRLSSSGGMRVVASTYGANVLNQYTNLTTQQPGNSTTAVLGYDLNGNQLVHYRSNADGSSVTNYLEWDISDRLTSIHDASSNLVARYTYDPFGRRLSKTVFSGGTSNVTYFLYADEGLVAEFDEAGNEIRAYGYAPGSLWMNDPLYLRTFDVTPSTFYFLSDHLGAPQKLVGKNGAVVWAMVSESFGETVVWEGSTITNHLRFSSQYWDEESGLHYNTMRYYDAETGRYLSRDPIEEQGGVNLHGFVGNDPVDGVDPFGLAALPAGGIPLLNPPLPPGIQIRRDPDIPGGWKVEFPPLGSIDIPPIDSLWRPTSKPPPPVGKVTWSSRCACDLTAEDRQRVENELSTVREKLAQQKKADWKGLPLTLGVETASCLLRELEHPSINCLSKNNPGCRWYFYAIALPGGCPNMCAANIKAELGAEWLTELAIHEYVHVCGKIGHKGDKLELGSLDDPDEWARWLAP